MSKVIILEEKTYDRLETIKKGLGHKVSFNTVVKGLIREILSPRYRPENFTKIMLHEIQRKEIFFFLRELVHKDLLDEPDLESLTTLVQLLINQKYEKLASIINEKAWIIIQNKKEVNRNLSSIVNIQKGYETEKKA